MIASNKNMCEGHRLRLEWVDRIGDQLDLYGRGFKEIADKEEGLCDYMFSVAIENGQYETYFTEKLLDCFATGTIPVYLGAPDIGEHFNKDGIIDLTEELIFLMKYTIIRWMRSRIILNVLRKWKFLKTLSMRII